jgi:hypothetical protein
MGQGHNIFSRKKNVHNVTIVRNGVLATKKNIFEERAERIDT